MPHNLPRKWYFLQPDGASDEPQEKLAGKTPLQAAKTPHLDQLVAQGDIFSLQTIPDGYEPGSDIGNLSLLGYDPRQYFTGRAPIEAAAQGIVLKSGEVAFRCNFVTMEVRAGQEVMADFSAGHISTQESAALIASLQAVLPDLKLQVGVSYRNTLVARVAIDDLKTTPPHNIQDQPIVSYLPQGAASTVLAQWSQKAREVLKNHPVNQARIAAGKRPATDIWLWGQGKATQLPAFTSRYPGYQGYMITAVDLLRGIACLSGMQNIAVAGATGFIDTNFRGKAQAAIDVPAGLVFLHLEAPDESAHMGSLEHKLTAIERFDADIVGPIFERAQKENAGIIVTPDHPTLIATKAHALANVPCVIWVPGKKIKPHGLKHYSEEIIAKGEVFQAWHLLDYVFKTYK